MRRVLGYAASTPMTHGTAWYRGRQRLDGSGPARCTSSVSAAELTGRTLGDFVVRHRIGEGGFGEVYRAEQPVLGREAVIKVLHHRHRATRIVIQRFLREARLASRLDHPYAAHIYAFGVEHDGLTWIAMEYVKGKTLYDLLRENGPMPLEELVPLLDRICEVLQAAHDLGIVHRDIKPPNVMVVQRAGRAFPKLLDFGIAKASVEGPAPMEAAASPGGPRLTAPRPSTTPYPQPAVNEPVPPIAGELQSGDHTVSFVGPVGGLFGGGLSPRPELRPDVAASGQAPTLAVVSRAPSPLADVDGPALTEAGATMGSPPYMAPEQWEDSSAATARTDLYALAIMTYEALVGRRPIVGPTLAALAIAHSMAPIPSLGPGFPVELDAVMVKALAKRADERYPSAMAFAQAFRTAAGFGTQPLPAVDDDLRLSIEASFPQPIAEAVAAFHAARNAHQGRDALREIATTSIRYIALIALASQSQVRLVEPGSAVIVSELVRELRRRRLTDEEWLRLARALVSPFQANPRAHPLPDIVAVLSGTDESDPLTAVAQPHVADHDPLATIRALLPEVTRMLRALTFLADYPLVVVADGRAESWMGVRRPRRVAIEILGRTAEPGQPTLVDARGKPVVSLWPLVQTSIPLPGAATEVFLLDGRGRRGARLVAMPHALERQDETVWEWLTERFAERDGDKPVLSGSGGATPFRGLTSFTAEDAETFVGREREIDAAVNRLRVAPLVAIVGPSGAGKSSFVHAGIVPSLPTDWKTITVRPGAMPIAALEAHLRRAGFAVKSLATEMSNDPAALGAVFDKAESTTVLIVDQFEELFTLCGSAVEQQLYIRGLLAAAQSRDDRVRVVFTLRDDFLARAIQIPELRERLPNALFLLGTPAPADLLRILNEPLARLGFEFEDPGLPERMVADVADTPGALALLSFTAQKLWEQRDRHFRQLTRKAYEAVGGVAGALAQHAETTLAAMSLNEQRLARVALVHLVTADGTRAVLSRTELDQLLADPNANSVIEKLIAARLLTATEAEGRDDSIELVHEALLVAWPRLATWRSEDAEGSRMRDQVRAAARQWIERGNPGGLLWRGDTLAELAVWRRRYLGNLTDADEAFIRASVAEAARGRRIRQSVIGVVLVLMVVAVGILIWANRRTDTERALAVDARSLAERRALDAKAALATQYEEQGRLALLQGAVSQALVYLSAAYASDADDPALHFLLAQATHPHESLRAILLGHSGGIKMARYSPDGETIVTASVDGSARLWDADTGHLEHILTNHTGEVTSVQFSPDGSRVVTASRDGTARIWDAANGTQVLVLAHEAGLTSAEFSPDGKSVATSSLDRTARLWDAETARLIVRLAHDAPVQLVRFSPDGNRLVTTTWAGSVRLWDAHTGRLVADLKGHAAMIVPSAVFSHDSRQLATASYDGTARLWDAKDGSSVAVLRGHLDRVSSVAFSPDGKRLLTVSYDQTGRLWDTTSGVGLAVLQARGSQVVVAAFDRDGERIATGNADGIARIWDAHSGAELAVFAGHGTTVNDIVFSADGRSLLTASADATARLWDATSSVLIATLRDHTDVVTSASFSPDGRRVITTSEDKTANIVDVMSGLTKRLTGHDGEVMGGVFSPDGKRAVTVSLDHTARVWDATTGALLVVLREHADSVYMAAFSHDGTRLVTTSADNRAIVWDTATYTPTREIHDHDLVAARFDPTGHRLATVSYKSHVKVWDVATGNELLVLSQARGTDAEFSHDGSRIITANNDGTAQMWDGRDGHLLGSLVGHASLLLSARFSPDDQRILTASDDRTAKVWDATSYRLLASFQTGAGGFGRAEFSPDGNRIVTPGVGITTIWDVGDDHRSRVEQDEFVDCYSALKLDGPRLVARQADPTRCLKRAHQSSRLGGR